MVYRLVVCVSVLLSVAAVAPPTEVNVTLGDYFDFCYDGSLEGNWTKDGKFYQEPNKDCVKVYNARNRHSGLYTTPDGIRSFAVNVVDVEIVQVTRGQNFTKTYEIPDGFSDSQWLVVKGRRRKRVHNGAMTFEEFDEGASGNYQRTKFHITDVKERHAGLYECELNQVAEYFHGPENDTYSTYYSTTLLFYLEVVPKDVQKSAAAPSTDVEVTRGGLFELCYVGPPGGIWTKDDKFYQVYTEDDNCIEVDEARNDHSGVYNTPDGRRSFSVRVTDVEVARATRRQNFSKTYEILGGFGESSWYVDKDGIIKKAKNRAFHTEKSGEHRRSGTVRYERSALHITDVRLRYAGIYECGLDGVAQMYHVPGSEDYHSYYYTTLIFTLQVV